MVGVDTRWHNDSGREFGQTTILLLATTVPHAHTQCLTSWRGTFRSCPPTYYSSYVVPSHARVSLVMCRRRSHIPIQPYICLLLPSTSPIFLRMRAVALPASAHLRVPPPSHIPCVLLVCVPPTPPPCFQMRAVPPAAALLLLLLVPLPPAAAAPPPNILFIMSDDLGYGELSSYPGGPGKAGARIATPHIDALAATGMKFTHAYAGDAVCGPSRNALLVGQHTGHTQVRGNVAVGGHDLPLRATDVTLPMVLAAAAGYRTAAVGKWGLGEGSKGAHGERGG